MKICVAVFCCCLFSGFAFGQTKNGLPKNLLKNFWTLVCDENCTQAERARWQKRLKIEKHDLNGDNVSEYFLFIEHGDWCGAGSNCDYWVFQKRGNDFQLLLNGKQLRVKSTASNGLKDLASETPMGFCERNVQRLSVTNYQFNGREYEKTETESECRAFTPARN